MNNKYVKMLGVGLLVVGLVAWRQSIITMEPEESKDWNWKEVQKGRSKEYSELLQDAVKNAEAEAEKDKATEKLVRGFLPPDMQKEIFKNKPAHPFLLRYLINKLCLGLNKPTFRHTNQVISVAFSPDGKFILTGSDNIAKLWDIKTVKEIYIFNHNKPIASVAFSPDGKYVLTGSADFTAKLWDVETGNEIRIFNHGDMNTVRSVAFSPDGKFVLTIGMKAKLWNVETGQEIHTFFDGPILYGAFSPDSQFVLTGNGFGKVALWDIKTGQQELSHDFRALFRKPFTIIGFSPDGNVLINLYDHSKDLSTVELWEIKIGSIKKICTFNQQYNVVRAAFSPDGKYVLTVSQDRAKKLWNAKLWDVKADKEIHTFNYDNLGDMVRSVAFSPDGKFVLIGFSNGMAKLWDISCINALIEKLQFVTVDQYNLLQACGDVLEKFLVKKEKLGRIYLNKDQQIAFDALPDDIKKELEFIVKRPELTDEEKREIARQANLKKFDKSNK